MNPRLRRFALIVVVPTLFLLLGAWQLQRSATDAVDYDREAASLAGSAARLEAPGMENRTVAIPGISERYRAPTAAVRLRKAETVLRHHALVARLRQAVAAAAIAGAALCLAAGGAGLFIASYAARRSALSRAALVDAFTTARRLLPILLGAQVAGLALALFAVVLFEAAGAWYLDRLDSGALKLIACAVILAGLALYLAWLTLRDLAGARAAFTPDPLPVFGRQVTAPAAPGLWQFIAGLAARQGALVPDHVVVGLHDGFFVTSSEIVLSPDDVRLRGRTLYLPAPALALLDRDETAAVIAHELAHFTGEDTAYTQRFLPVYAGIGRSLWAVQQESEGGWLLRPAETLGLHVMDTFDTAVNHWSRLRELAADQASVPSAGPGAAASALIRNGLIAGVAEAVLRDAIDKPQAAPRDLVAAIVHQATTAGIGDPHDQLTISQPHPTDSHPANVQRIQALGVEVDDILLARAARPARTEDAHLRSLFADWSGLCATITTDTLTVAAEQDEQFEATLRTHAALAAETPTAVYRATRRSLLLTGLVGVVLLVCFIGLTYVLLAFPSVQPDDLLVLVPLDACLLVGVLVAVMKAALTVRGGRTPFLTLRQDAITCRGLDRPIPWLEIADIRVGTAGYTLITLMPDAALPRRTGRWSARVSAQWHCVTLLGTVPRGLTLQAYQDLLDGYRNAAHARAVLAVREAAAP